MTTYECTNTKKTVEEAKAVAEAVKAERDMWIGACVAYTAYINNNSQCPPSEKINHADDCPAREADNASL